MLKTDKDFLSLYQYGFNANKKRTNIEKEGNRPKGRQDWRQHWRKCQRYGLQAQDWESHFLRYKRGSSTGRPRFRSRVGNEPRASAQFCLALFVSHTAETWVLGGAQWQRCSRCTVLDCVTVFGNALVQRSTWQSLVTEVWKEDKHQEVELRRLTRGPSKWGSKGLEKGGMPETSP